MSRLEALPADQKSVLALLLRQGKGYDDLSGLLHLDVSEVRSRAYDALDTLGPGAGAGGLSAQRRHEISDWLLGQQDPNGAAATRAFLDGSAAGRVWAHGVARELEPLAGDRLPELPAEDVATETQAPAPAPETEPEPEPAATPFAPAPSAAPRVSRRGGALLIGGVLAAIAVAVVLVLVLTGGDDQKADSTATKAANTTSTAAQPQVRAQINLTPPKDGPIKKAVAIVQILDVSGQPGITAATQGLPTGAKKAAYALWFYNSPSQARLIGGFDKTDNKGHLVLQGQLPKDLNVASYKEALVTRETSGNPTKPGTIYLRGSIQSAAGG